MSTIFAATDADTLKNLALGLSGASLLVAVILMKVISSIVGKVISSAVFVALALAGYSQRAEISDCADKVKSQATTSASIDTTCTFFGQDITVKVPLPTK
ncbi:MAG: hypothetical protein ACO3JF_04850 [Ilumatobacteraceae bacterium]